MIKRFLVSLIAALCFVFPASANLKISPDAVDIAIKENFKQTKDRSSALATYTASLDKGGAISAESIYKVCVAGGIDIKTKDGKSKCDKFKTALTKGASPNYYEVCGKDKGKTGGTEHCIYEFSGTEVTLSNALLLAREYARVKKGDATVECNKKFRTVDRQDYIKCSSRDSATYYEFQFDNVEEYKDDKILDETYAGVCEKIFGGTAMGKCYETQDRKSWLDNCYKQCKDIGPKKCNAEFAESMNKFGYSTYYYQSGRACLSDTRPVVKKSALKTAYGIDNFIFCAGIQMQNTPTVDDGLKTYIVNQAKKQGVTLTPDQVKCGAGARTYTGSGCNINGVTDFKDDIKTCTVGNKQIDFVFDDINEKWKSYHDAGVEAVQCIVEEGVYAGKSCLGLSQAKCDKIRKAVAAECPDCPKVSWNAELEQCVLPSSAKAEDKKKTIQIATIAATAAIAVGVTVATGGTAGAGGFLLLVEVTGAAIEIDQTVKIQHIAEEFFAKSNKCREPKCAEDLVKQYLQRLSNIYNELTDAEAKAADQEMARLFELIPESSAVYNGSRLKDNQLSMFDGDSWEPEQVWRAIGVGLQMAGLVAGFFKWLAKTPKMANTTRVITTKLQKALPAAKQAKALNAAKEMKALPAHADDALKALGPGPMSRADAKALEDIAAREAKLAKGKKLSQTDIYKREEIYNKYQSTIGNSENINMAAKAVMKQEKIAGVEADLAKAQENLRWAREHPGNISKAEMASRERAVQNLEKELSDLGVTYTKVADEATDATRAASKAGSATGGAKSAATKTDDAARAASKSDDMADVVRIADDGGPVDVEIVDDAVKNANKADEAVDAGRAASKTANKIESKSEKIAAAQKRGDLGYHGTDADIAMDDMIRASGNTSEQLGSVGYGIARDYDAAEKYAVKRLIERQNVGKNINFYRDGDVLIIESTEPVNISKKTGYVYTTAKDSSVKWEGLQNGYVGRFDAAQMPNSVEILDKKVFDLDDLVRQGKVKISAPTIEDVTDAGVKAAKVASGVDNAAHAAGRSVTELDDFYRIGQKAATREEILAKWGLSPNATDAEIAARYRELSKHFHPDMYASDATLSKQVESIFADIAEENRLLKSLPKGTKGVIEGTKAEMKALPAAATKTAGLFDDVPMIGHNLIGAAAATRALARTIDVTHPEGGLVNAGSQDGAVVVPGGGNGGNNSGGNGNGGNGNGTISSDGNGDGDATVISNGGNGNGGSGIVNNGNGNNGGGATTVSGSGRPTTFTPDKQKNIGLIVGLTAAGLVATGAVVGGVVAATTAQKKTSETTPAVDSNISEMENIMYKANGTLGTVNGKNVSLVSLPTTVNTNTKLVAVENQAVAVVVYDGHKLPYFIKNGKWTPLLGIGEKGHWFNVYPKSTTGIKTIDMITNVLNQQISPNIVSQYIGINAMGVSLPVAAVAAFSIINSEFTNGVVQRENMTPQDAKLYSANYDLIKNKLK